MLLCSSPSVVHAAFSPSPFPFLGATIDNAVLDEFDSVPFVQKCLSPNEDLLLLRLTCRLFDTNRLAKINNIKMKSLSGQTEREPSPSVETYWVVDVFGQNDKVKVRLFFFFLFSSSTLFFCSSSCCDCRRGAVQVRDSYTPERTVPAGFS